MPAPTPAFDIASLRFDERGLVPAIAQSQGGEVLMLAWMNA
ncbi:MAG TPA: phosphoribosyl-AMP cyclohydrolase, partial [Amaricoccus sp.]|nr:phosphoribosyl-AMP cyclohydrolase [Amaricoccus sp.]